MTDRFKRVDGTDELEKIEHSAGWDLGWEAIGSLLAHYAQDVAGPAASDSARREALAHTLRKFPRMASRWNEKLPADVVKKNGVVVAERGLTQADFAAEVQRRVREIRMAHPTMTEHAAYNQALAADDWLRRHYAGV
jgi:hypothetical protein